MPRLARKLPSYRVHKPSGRAVVTLDGRDHYLGTFGTPESRDAYDRAVSEWLASRPARTAAPDSYAPPYDLTVSELMLAFWRHAERHYKPGAAGRPGELGNFRDTLRPLKRLYGPTLAREFSPLKLKAVRQAMTETGLARGTINQRVGRIVHVFKWAASEELVPASVHQALKTLSGLQKGRTDAREPEPVKPVPEPDVEAVRPHVSRQVWAMIELQWLTGMRPGEVVIMRTAEVDRTGRIWEYVPTRHKTEHRGRSRTVYLGPKAQEVLRPWLRIDPAGYLFQPAEAFAERKAATRQARKTPVQPSQQDRQAEAP